MGQKGAYKKYGCEATFCRFCIGANFISLFWLKMFRKEVWCYVLCKTMYNQENALNHNNESFSIFLLVYLLSVFLSKPFCKIIYQGMFLGDFIISEKLSGRPTMYYTVSISS